MAHLTRPPGYGNNSWDESTWASAMAMQLPPFKVRDADAWKPTVVTGLDRTVQVALGAAWGCGVWDRTDATENIGSFDINFTGTDRYDLLLATWSWTTRTVVFRILKGGSVPPSINTGLAVDATKVNRIPGVQYDAIIAVVRIRAGNVALASTDLVDCRVWGGAGTGALATPQTERMALIDLPIGAQLLTLTNGWQYRRTATTWKPVIAELSLTAQLRRSDGSLRLNAADTVLKLFSPTAVGPWDPNYLGRGASTDVPGQFAITPALDTNITGSRYVQLSLTGTASRNLPPDVSPTGFGSSGGTVIVDAPAGLAVTFSAFSSLSSEVDLRASSTVNINWIGPLP